MVAEWLLLQISQAKPLWVAQVRSGEIALSIPAHSEKRVATLLKAMGLRQEKLLSLLDQASKFSVPRGNLEWVLSLAGMLRELSMCAWPHGNNKGVYKANSCELLSSVVHQGDERFAGALVSILASYNSLIY